MSQPNPSGSKGISLDVPSRTGNTAPPPDPKIQAVNFAIQLAGINATMVPQQEVTANQIVADAQTIATFLGGAR